MTDINSYKNYLDNLQQPAGWFELIYEICQLMSHNANNNEQYQFLSEAGARVAQYYPLPVLDNLTALTSAINIRLDLFKWGYCEIEAKDKFISIIHHCLPVDNQDYHNDNWNYSIAAIIGGLYSAWFKQAGSSDKLTLVINKLNGANEVVYRLQSINHKD